MNFEQIKSFLSVARTGNFSQAAKERYLSQPTISNQLKLLEKELGVQLFLRNSKNITLTEQGRMFHKYANKLVSIEKDIMIGIKENQQMEYGILDIVAPHLQTDRQFGGFLNHVLEEQRKGVMYRIVERNDEDIPGLVLSGEVELGVTNTVINDPKLGYEKAFVEEIVLITPNEEKYRDLSPEKLRTILLEEGHIRYDFGSGSDFLWNDFFGKTIGVELHNIKTVARCSNYNIILEAVKEGRGIAFMSSTVMQKEWKNGEILAYRCKELLEKPFYVVYLKERVESSEILCHAKKVLVEEMNCSIDNPDKSF